MEQDMPNGKPGSPGWKNKLDDVGELPGYIVQDKNAAWEKLHSRLQEKPPHIRPAWYWIAAAGILFVGLLPLFTASDRQIETVKKDNLKIIPAETAVHPGSMPGTSTTTMHDEPAVRKTVINHLPIQPVAGKTSRSSTTANEKQPVQRLGEQEFLTQAEIETKPIDSFSTKNTVVMAPPLKQRLKVVHINELGEPAPHPNADQGRDYSFIQIRIITQQANTSSRATAKGISFNISKPKASSTN